MTHAAVTLHASSVAIGDRAVLIRGPSGSGKSDLALRLIDRGATLVSDDYTVLTPADAGLLASAPATIAGRIEVRGVGIATLPYRADVPVALLVTLGDEDERLPEPRRDVLAGVPIREVRLDAFRASTPAKVELALRQPEAMPA